MTALERACQISIVKRFFGEGAAESSAAREIAEAMEAHAAEAVAQWKAQHVCRPAGRGEREPAQFG